LYIEYAKELTNGDEDDVSINEYKIKLEQLLLLPSIRLKTIAKNKMKQLALSLL
jgi:hypothetical protein